LAKPAASEIRMKASSAIFGESGPCRAAAIPESEAIAPLLHAIEKLQEAALCRLGFRRESRTKFHLAWISHVTSCSTAERCRGRAGYARSILRPRQQLNLGSALIIEWPEERLAPEANSILLQADSAQSFDRYALEPPHYLNEAIAILADEGWQRPTTWTVSLPVLIAERDQNAEYPSTTRTWNRPRSELVEVLLIKRPIERIA